MATPNAPRNAQSTEIMYGGFAVGQAIRRHTWHNLVSVKDSQRDQVLRTRINHIQDKIYRTKSWADLFNVVSDCSQPPEWTQIFFRALCTGALSLEDAKAYIALGTVLIGRPLTPEDANVNPV